MVKQFATYSEGNVFCIKSYDKFGNNILQYYSDEDWGINIYKKIETSYDPNYFWRVIFLTPDYMTLFDPYGRVMYRKGYMTNMIKRFVYDDNLLIRHYTHTIDGNVIEHGKHNIDFKMEHKLPRSVYDKCMIFYKESYPKEFIDDHIHPFKTYENNGNILGFDIPKYIL